MDTLAAEYLAKLADPFINPQKRIFIGYLLSSVLIACVVAIFANHASLRKAFAVLFAKRIWLSCSAIADYKVLLINQAVMMGIAPRLISKLVIATILFEALHVWFNGRILLWTGVPGWIIASSFTICLFLFDDVTKYLLHRALHRWPILWSFHKVHHTAEVLTPLTVYRTHPVEAVLFAIRSTVVQAITISAFLFFFADRTTLVTILGANAFLFFFNLAGSNLRHSHVWISYGRFLEHWLISPAQHQIHHSIEERHFDRNFGSVLAIWDRLGGSLAIASSDNRPTAFGVDANDKNQTQHSIYAIYVRPFGEAIGQIMKPVQALIHRLKLQKLPSQSTNSDFVSRSQLKKTDGHV